MKRRLKEKKFFMSKMLFIIILVSMIFGVLSGCSALKKPTEKATYTLKLSGKVNESGVINYAGYEMNVYKNLASNPCGTCADQPVSVYAGTSAEDVAKAIGKATTRADDIWKVKEIKGGTIVFEEKTIGQSKVPGKPSAPAGLSISGEYIAAK